MAEPEESTEDEPESSTEESTDSPGVATVILFGRFEPHDNAVINCTKPYVYPYNQG